MLVSSKLFSVERLGCTQKFSWPSLITVIGSFHCESVVVLAVLASYRILEYTNNRNIGLYFKFSKSVWASGPYWR